MDKFLYGKLLGEMYRTQNKVGHSGVGEGTVYGLINGIETIIDEEIDRIQRITSDDFNNATEILNEYFYDKEKLESVTGYYDLEFEFENKNLNRPKMSTLLTYFYSNGGFVDLIDKFDSSNSPGEMRKFTIFDYDR